MSGKTHIQVDWEQREFVETVALNMKKITEFLNKFGKSFLVMLSTSHFNVNNLSSSNNINPNTRSFIFFLYSVFFFSVSISNLHLLFKIK